MDTQNITAQLIDYRTDNLTAAQINEVEQQLESSEEWQMIFAELALLDDLMAAAPVVQPSVSAKQRFERLLAIEKQSTPVIEMSQSKNALTFSIRQLLQIAAAIALLIMGVGIGVQFKNNQSQQTEIAALKSEMLGQKKLLALSLLQQTSASDRIKGVNISLKETDMDDQILNALIDRMNLDKNINVQLKAIEGLVRFGENQIVITAFIKALKNQKSPEIQIAIIEALVALKVKDAYPQFQEILRDKETIDAVKNSAASGLEILL